MVDGQRFAPDVAYVGPGKRFVNRGYNPDPPDLAVEVVSDESERSDWTGWRQSCATTARPASPSGSCCPGRSA